MLNIGVVCDITWDNYILIEKKIKKICGETFRLHSIYGKTLTTFDNCCNKNGITLIRHYSENICNTIYNMLRICDIWLVFSNLIEFLTPSSLIIEKCQEYNINYIIISEYSRNKDYYSFEIKKDLSFKKIINGISPKEKLHEIEKFDLKIYNDNFTTKQVTPLTLNNDIKEKLKSIYDKKSQDKKEKSIKLLYDKDELKKEKGLKKTMKAANQLEFVNNRIKYYNN